MDHDKIQLQTAAAYCFLFSFTPKIKYTKVVQVEKDNVRQPP